MENCISTVNIQYKNINEYKMDIETVIKDMIIKSERLVFSSVAEKAAITPFVVRQYPELRTYILQSMMHYKEIQVIDEKIERAVINLSKARKSITFLAIMNKCKFSSEMVYKNEYIKEKIRNTLAENKGSVNKFV